MKIIVTCEHGGNKIPEKYKQLFTSSKERLASHEGYDIGALRLAEEFGEKSDSFFYTEISRLFVELNRSLKHPQLFSDLTSHLNPKEKESILKQYYFPYRNEVTHTVKDAIREGELVLHLSVHSFTPNLNGEMRSADVGLLYDPKRLPEKKFCSAWKKEILVANPTLKIRFNYPYRGAADGLVTYLRKQFPPDSYVGIELEVNQKDLIDPGIFKLLQMTLIDSFENTLLQLF